MTDNRFTQSAQTALMQAFSCARGLSHSFIGSEHILLGVFNTHCPVTYRALCQEGLTYDMVLACIKQKLGVEAQPSRLPLSLSNEGAAIIEGAVTQASLCGLAFVSAEHLLLSIISQPHCGGAVVLQRCGVKGESLLLRLGSPSAQRTATQPKRSELKLTMQFGTDLSKKASSGGFDPVVGRDEETARVIQILTRRQKSNPVLIGDAGVGKTAIVENLSCMIASGKVPRTLSGKRLISLDIACLISGTKYRGEFEERTRQIIDEVKNAGDVILFIDEMHMLAGAGAAEGAIDAANILKPALSRSQIQMIGATTAAEYKKHIRGDKALARRFQPVEVCEPSCEKTKKILAALRPKYEAFHGIRITDEAIDAAVNLSGRHMPERFFPDKAIDLMDEASSHAALGGRFCATGEDVHQVLCQMKGISGGRLDRQEREKLSNLRQQLSEIIIGQEEAVESVSRAVCRSRAFGARGRPGGSFLFCGPSGVGKTSLAKALAQIMFGSSDAMIRLDMSEYMEKHSISRLIGAPPGYVGYGQGGLLTEKIRRAPHSLVLFDEIEKAHPDVLNLLLQILEEGTLTDSEGERADFQSSIVILTSNIGLEGGYMRRAGFISGQSGQEMKKNILSAVKRTLRPELLSRIDQVVVFSPLSDAQLQDIASRQLSQLRGRLMDAGISLSWDDTVPRALCLSGSGTISGARMLRQNITERIEDPIADRWIAGDLPEAVSLSSAGRQIIIS